MATLLLTAELTEIEQKNILNPIHPTTKKSIVACYFEAWTPLSWNKLYVGDR